MVHVLLMFLSEWHEFPLVPCLAGKKLDDSSHLDVAEIAHVTLRASFQPLLQEKTCNSAHEQTALSNDTTDTVQHGEVGEAKDLSAPTHSLRYLFKKKADLDIVISMCAFIHACCCGPLS